MIKLKTRYTNSDQLEAIADGAFKSFRNTMATNDINDSVNHESPIKCTIMT